MVLAAAVEPLTLARDQTIATLDALDDLLPDSGLARGTLVEIRSRAGGTRSLALALVAASTRQGQWAAFVGLAGLDMAAGAELGVALERVAVVDRPPPEQWATVVAALIGSFEVVVIGAPTRVRQVEVRRLQARARERGSVLVVVGGGPRVRPLHQEAELRFFIDQSRWHGLGSGHGHLRTRRVTVETSGRRSAARVRRVDLWLPGPDGQVQRADDLEADIVPFPATA